MLVEEGSTTALILYRSERRWLVIGIIDRTFFK